MSNEAKNKQGRKRDICIRFRVTETELKQIDYRARISGLTRQEYLLNNMLNQQVTVQGSIKIFKSLKDIMKEILVELKRIAAGGHVDLELIKLIKYIHDSYERVLS